MRFGIFGSARAADDRSSSGEQTFEEYLDYAAEAETLGFRASFLVEHHFSGWNQVSATLMVQTALAMRTRTLRLGTAVIVLPWHNPVLLAEQAATLDVLSGGRLDLGIGKGYRHNEFTGFRVPMEEAEPRFDEAVEVLVKSWSSRERFSHRGRFWQFDNIVVEPPPVQKPHPPLWVAAASEASIRKAARGGFNLILDQYASPQQIDARLKLYRGELEGSGGHYDPARVAVARQVYVAQSKAEASEALKRAAAYTRRTVEVSRSRAGGSHVLAYANTPGATEANALFDVADIICEKLEALAKIGVEYILVTALGGAEQLRRFARDVMPAFDHETGSWKSSPAERSPR